MTFILTNSNKFLRVKLSHLKATIKKYRLIFLKCELNYSWPHVVMHDECENFFSHICFSKKKIIIKT